jgi:hypothetical protein
VCSLSALLAADPCVVNLNSWDQEGVELVSTLKTDSVGRCFDFSLSCACVCVWIVSMPSAFYIVNCILLIVFVDTLTLSMCSLFFQVFLADISTRMYQDKVCRIFHVKSYCVLISCH